MAYFTPEDIQQAKQLDLLTYLQIYEPDQLVKVSGDTYCTREHDSLKISNGKWNWFSQKIGGKTALDYLVKVKGLSFMEAMETIHGAPLPKTIPAPAPKKESRTAKALKSAAGKLPARKEQDTLPENGEAQPETVPEAEKDPERDTADV